jgi:hypothetical protein
MEGSLWPHRTAGKKAEFFNTIGPGDFDVLSPPDAGSLQSGHRDAAPPPGAFAEDGH